jgi:hypothetical protein
MSHAETSRTLDLIWGHQIEAKPIDWLWEPWLARGAVSVLDGDPGVGKSSVTTDLAARLTAGRPLPLQAEGREPAVVLLVAMEDPLDRVAQPRFIAAGGDPTRVAFLGGVTEATAGGPLQSLIQLPRDLPLVADACRRLRPALLVIDPLFAVLGYDDRGRFIKSNDDQMVRQLTGRLKLLAEETCTAVVLVRHLNKSASGSALQRGSGTIGIAGQARSVLLAADDPEEDGVKVLAMTKTNLVARPPSLRYRLSGDGAASQVEWLGASHLTADDLVASEARRDRRADALLMAADFLEEALENGSRSWDDLVAAAGSKGIAEISLRRARAKIGLESERIRGNRVVWKLPFRLPPLGGV